MSDFNKGNFNKGDLVLESKVRGLFLPWTIKEIKGDKVKCFRHISKKALHEKQAYRKWVKAQKKIDSSWRYTKLSDYSDNTVKTVKSGVKGDLVKLKRTFKCTEIESFEDLERDLFQAAIKGFAECIG
jgi:hypothetical protein